MDIRKTYLDYFVKKGHLQMPSASLIPTNDPSVLLTTAGMQQFKPYYLGVEKPPKNRIVTVQKCFRTSDIDRVGYSDQHLTFFEMLGNFAFADYFKKEAINFTTDFILNILKIPIEKLSVGVFAGEGEIPEDNEAIQLWLNHGIAEEKIYKFGKSENFWGPAGDTGPCGPCTEIYYDFGKEYGCGNKNCSPLCECERFLEIWNLVFTQYNFTGKRYNELPNKNIDTGMGLERIEAVLEKNPSVFKTILFKDIIKKIEDISGKKMMTKKAKDFNPEINKCIKIIADHSRAINFLISDGVVPSNEGRGYILRRIIRRAIRFGRLLGINDYFLNDIAEVVINNYSSNYPELKEKREVASRIINDEEKRFSNTLKEGTKILSQKIEELKVSGIKYLDSEIAFRLYETYGFPVELTVEILNENNLSIDIHKFNEFMKGHSIKSREKTVFDKKIDKNIELYKQLAGQFKVKFTGYQENKSSSIIMSIIKYDKTDIKESRHGENSQILSGSSTGDVYTNTLNEGEEGEIILKTTPFYGERGGEIGDRGIIRIESTSSVFAVEDCKIPLDGIIIHKGRVREGKFKVGDEVSAETDTIFRKNIARNHTSTHLLHWALRTVFGKEVTQAGSYVADDRFRFDYNIALSPDTENMEKVERIINEKIQKDDVVRIFETTKEYAEEIGAISLFNEKYGKFVRVVEVDNYSRELCGGIHVNRTGEIGILKILSDSSIGANVRRIEAVTGIQAYNYLNDGDKVLKEISALLEAEPLQVKSKLEELKILEKKYEEDLNILQVKALKKEILSKFGIDMINSGINAGISASAGTQIGDEVTIIDFDFTRSEFKIKIDTQTMGLIGDELLNGFNDKNIFLIFGNIINGKPVLILQSSKDLLARGINCSVIAKDVGKILKGGGGGKPEFAHVGGSDSSMLSEAINYSKSVILEILR
jgi:alanyl-tRNA synthetase